MTSAFCTANCACATASLSPPACPAANFSWAVTRACLGSLHLGRRRLQRHLPANLGRRQIGPPLDHGVLLGRHGIGLLQVGLAVSHQILQLADLPLVEIQRIGRIAFVLWPWRRGPSGSAAAWASARLSWALATASFRAAMSGDCRSARFFFACSSSDLRRGDSRIGLRLLHRGCRCLQVGQVLLGRLQIALGLVQRLLVGRRHRWRPEPGRL